MAEYDSAEGIFLPHAQHHFGPHPSTHHLGQPLAVL